MIRCEDCGRPYGDEHGFPDLVVSHDVWRIISPTGDEGGLLCPSCMCRRAHAAGLANVPARFTSGPFAVRETRGVDALSLAATPPRPPLSRRQHGVLVYIGAFIAAHGYAPTQTEIATHFGYNSLATVSEHLSTLERKGYLARAFNRERGITLVGPQVDSLRLGESGPVRTNATSEPNR